MRRTRQLSLVQALLLAVITGVTLLGCTPSAPGCVEGLSLDCKPLFDPPSYQTIFDQVFAPTCAVGSGTCHTSDAAKKGLVFADADAAYTLLLSPTDTAPRVLPGNPACSTLMIRLESNDPHYRMPPGPTPLLAAARCAIALWIAAGAPR